MAKDSDIEDIKNVQELILELYVKTAKTLKKLRFRVK